VIFSFFNKKIGIFGQIEVGALPLECNTNQSIFEKYKEKKQAMQTVGGHWVNK